MQETETPRAHRFPLRKPDTFSLRSYKLGGQEIGFTISEGTMQVAGEIMDFERWIEIKDRVQTAMERNGWVLKASKFANAAPHEGKGSSFLDANVDEIIHRKQGRIKDPPFWLKWFCSGVLTKERFNG